MKKGHHEGQREKCLLQQLGNVHAAHEGHTEILVTEVLQMLETMTRCVKNLNHVVNGVSASGMEAGKIATAIDEIARQANLLALVASVETGRAGWKGAGLSAMAGKAKALSIKSADVVLDTCRHIEYEVTKLETINAISRLTIASLREKRAVA
jgi:methyl-accepting chemotaxis protein